MCARRGVDATSRIAERCQSECDSQRHQTLAFQSPQTDNELRIGARTQLGRKLRVVRKLVEPCRGGVYVSELTGGLDACSWCARAMRADAAVTHIERTLAVNGLERSHFTCLQKLVRLAAGKVGAFWRANFCKAAEVTLAHWKAIDLRGRRALNSAQVGWRWE